MAGDYMVCTSCLTQAGALVADTLEEFDGLINLAAVLHTKEVTGYNIGALSPAGFESVGIADSLQSRDSILQLPTFSAATMSAIANQFNRAGLAGIMEVKNPLDISPAAPDEVYLASIQAMLADERIDAVVTSLGSLSPNTSDTPDPEQPTGWVGGEKSMTTLLPQLQAESNKPLIVFNDAGRAHEPINETLRERGVPVFDNCSLAMTLLARYTAYRLSLRKRLVEDAER